MSKKTTVGSFGAASQDWPIESEKQTKELASPSKSGVGVVITPAKPSV